MGYTVTCNGTPMKISGSHSDCMAFVKMQKRKIKGAGLADDSEANHSPAYAAGCVWAIRPERSGDRDTLTDCYTVPASVTDQDMRIMGIKRR